MSTQAQKADAFRALHERAGAFIIPNPWDAGTAKLLASLRFEALATTSLGLSNMLGRVDGTMTVSRAEVLDNCRAIAEATDLPVSADLENGYAHEPRAAAEMIRLAADAGVVGGSIEDATGDAAKPIYDFGLAVERVHAAVETAHALPVRFVLTARAENMIQGRLDLDDTIKRLQAFEEAGADKHGLKIPTLRRFVAEGAYAEGVQGVIPTVTYPSHTTLITGVWPAKHGILSNTVFDPLRTGPANWYWYADDIRAPTLWDSAARAGWTTASIQWPASVGARVAWNIPE